jgi:hypothetical protein
MVVPAGSHDIRAHSDLARGDFGCARLAIFQFISETFAAITMIAALVLPNRAGMIAILPQRSRAYRLSLSETQFG